MITLPAPYRRAVLSDAPSLAELVNFAGEGMPYYLWERMAKQGESAWEVGRSRAEREQGSFSYRNAVVADDNGGAVAALVGYKVADEPEPTDDLPPMFVPLQELENLVCSTWYVNVLAAYPDHRNLGHGGRFLNIAELLAADLQLRCMSVIVSNANRGAGRLYERAAYSEIARRPMVKEDWVNDGTEWVLLTKSLA
jgi:ribosomal protein S18 acetylase RimI-like enzyme